ncbi:MAG: ADP-ribosylation factor-like protein [Candidatus Jordarchaeaceae archaeon]
MYLIFTYSELQVTHVSLSYKRFSPRGSAGVLLVVDSTNPETFSLARDILFRVKREISGDVPVVILANKQDLKGALPPEEVAKQLNIGVDVPVVGTVATQNQGLREALQLILKQISKKGEIRTSK